jgi:hypothetical protein
MNLKSAIDWYKNDRFNSADLHRATGLSERSQRELLKLGILRAVPQSRTAARLFDSHMVKRAALIFPLHEHGNLSLLVSGKIVFANALLESLLFDVIDPWQAYQRKLDKAPHGEKEWGWFSSQEDPLPESGDHHIFLFNRHYVASGMKDAPVVYGHLSDDCTDMAVFSGAVYDELLKPSENVPDWTQNQFHPGRALAGEARKFKSKRASKSDGQAVQQAIASPISTFSVNASLTLRNSLRRLLKMGDSA